MSSIKSILCFLLFLIIFGLPSKSFAATSCTASYDPDKATYSPGDTLSTSVMGTGKGRNYEFTLAKSGQTSTNYPCKEDKTSPNDNEILTFDCTLPDYADGTYLLTVSDRRGVYLPGGAQIPNWWISEGNCSFPKREITVATAVSSVDCPTFAGTTPTSPTKNDAVTLNFAGGQPNNYTVVVDNGRANKKNYSMQYPTISSISVGTFPNDPLDHSLEILMDTNSGYKICGGGNFQVRNPVASNIEARCNTTVTIDNMIPCGSASDFNYSYAIRCGSSGTGFACRDDAQAQLCLNGGNKNEGAVICQKAKPTSRGGSSGAGSSGASSTPKTSGAGMTCDPGTNKKDATYVEAHRGNIYTALGCLPTEPSKFVQTILKFAVSLGGGIALLLMIYGAFRMITSAGNPEAIKAGHEQFTSAIIGLLFIIFSVLLLKIIGVDILQIPGFTP